MYSGVKKSLLLTMKISVYPINEYFPRNVKTEIYRVSVDRKLLRKFSKRLLSNRFETEECVRNIFLNSIATSRGHVLSKTVSS